jgi:tetratricopeptide (TPR) repeat protein
LNLRAVSAVCGFCFLFSAFSSLSAQNTAVAESYYRQAQTLMFNENWYEAAEALLECVARNPAHAGGTTALAECYSELGEYDQALSWARKARALSRADSDTANLEASILVALGKLDEAAALISGILAGEPYNREALFVAAELEIARGHPAGAVERYREAVRLFPDDRRLLVSLALVLGSMGDAENARAYIERAQLIHSDDYRVSYYAAYLAARAGDIPAAAEDAEAALRLRPDFLPARSLLASLRYRAGAYAEAERLADEIIAAERGNTGAWFLKARALVKTGRQTEARALLETASVIDPEDEFIRAALEALIIEGTALEDPGRRRWADWHFSRAASFRARNLSDQALFEYRRGLRLNPYAAERQAYAEILRLQGYAELYLEELVFLRDMGRKDQTLDETIEIWNARLNNTLPKRWALEHAELKPHWNIAVFSRAGGEAAEARFHHTDASAVTAGYINDLLIHERNIRPVNRENGAVSFSEAFRLARASGGDDEKADYFLLVSVNENERELAIKAELYAARTGAPVAAFSAYRSGEDRLRNASRSITEQLAAALPFRGALLRRSAATGLIDKGKIDGVTEGTVYNVLRRGGDTERGAGRRTQVS